MPERAMLTITTVFILYLCYLPLPTDTSRLPPAPRKLRARAISPHVIKLKWRDPGKGRDRSTRFYSIRYSTLGEEDDSKYIQSHDSRVRVGKLHPNTTYVFSVKSIVGKKGSPWSKRIVVTTAVVENSVVTKLRATPLSSESIRLSWKLPKMVDETVAYAILWTEIDIDDTDRKAVVANGSTSFLFDNLRPYRLYSFRVQSILGEGPGGSTEKVVARPFSDKPGKSPRNLALHYSNDSYVLVTWLPPPVRQQNGILQGSKIQYKRKGSRHGDLCTVITRPQDSQYVLTDIADGETYKVRVAATTVNGTGPYSKWETVDIPVKNQSDFMDRKYKKKAEDVRGDEDTGLSDDTPATPEKLTASVIRSTMVTITWSQPKPPDCCPIVAYRIMGRNLNTSTLSGEIVTGPKPEARISFLQADTLYGFNVSAYSIAGESEHSEELIVQTLPAAPPSILSVHGSTVIEGSSVNLTCVVRAEPPPEVTWFGPNKTLPYSSGRATNTLLHREDGVQVVRLHKSSHDVTSYLLIDQVAVDQSGAYSCVAKNNAGTVRKPVMLQVNVVPSIVESSGATVMDGGEAKLQCTVSGSPLPTVVWLREEGDTVFEEKTEESKLMSLEKPFVRSVVVEEEDEETVRQSYLIFPYTSLSHHGNYTCLARSLAGTKENKVFLQVNTHSPPPVQNLRALALSPVSVSVAWEKPVDYNYSIDGYRVSYRLQAGGPVRHLKTQGQKQIIYGLQPRKEYVINVTAYNSNSLGAAERQVTVTTLSNERLQPANVSALALNSSMIQLDWRSPQNIDRMYILGYNIYYRRENDTQEEMLFIEGNRNKQFLIGLGRDETYYLRIATLTTWGFEAPSQWIRIQKHPHELLPPVAPRNVEAVTTLDSIRVMWISSKEPGSKKSPLLGYRIIYGPVDRPSAITRMELDPSTDQFTIRGLNASTLYIIAITAFNKYTSSDPAYVRAETKAMPPSTVINATAVALSATEIHVHWQPPAKGLVTKYQLRYWRPGKRDKQSAWLQAPTSNYVAGSLKPFSSYRFEIIPFSNELIGDGSVIFCDTFSSKPDAPPQDVVMTTQNATQLLVTWKAPPEESQNGIISSYKLILKKKNGPRLAKFNVDGFRYNYTFKNLEPGSTYKVRMAAVNVNGTGPFTDWVVADTDKIEMRQPESPQMLKLQVDSQMLTLTWSPPPDIGVPVLGYIVGYGRYIPEVYRDILGPGVQSYVIKDLKPETEYIVSVRAFNHMGESVPQFAIVHTLSAPVLKLEVPLKLTVVPLSPRAMALSWLDPALLRKSAATVSPSTLPQTDGRVYLIRYSAISGENYQYLSATETALNVSGLEVATTYEFAVRTIQGDQQSGWSLPVVSTTQQTAPSTAPEGVTVLESSGLSTPSLVVHWSQPTLPNGHIEEYIVYYTTNPSIDSKLWMIKTTDKKSIVIDDILPYTPYYFRVQARNAAGYGPLSDTVGFNPPTDSRAAPRSVTVENLYGNISTAVEVMWLRPDKTLSHITGYMVYYTSDNSQSDSSWMIRPERGLSSIILGLSYNTTYRFKVCARYGVGLGPFSQTVHFTTPEETDWSESETEAEERNPHMVNSTGVELESDSSASFLNQTETSTGYLNETETFITTRYPTETEQTSESAVTKAILPPSGLTVEVGSDHVNVTWEAPGSNTKPVSQQPEPPANSSRPVKYQLELLKGTEKPILVTTRIVTENSYTFTQLEEDASYIIKVKAISRKSVSSPTVQLFHTYQLHQTTGLTHR